MSLGGQRVKLHSFPLPLVFQLLALTSDLLKRIISLRTILHGDLRKTSAGRI